MKTDIHPTYESAKIVCSCGNTVDTRSTKSDLTVEICSNCHPFYTGKQKFIDTGGRMDRFNKKLEAAGSATSTKKSKSKSRNFAPAVDPKVLKAKADRAAQKAREDAERRKAEAAAAKEAEAQAKKEAEEAKKAAAEAEANAKTEAESAPAEEAPKVEAEATPEAAPEATEETKDAPAEESAE